MSDLFVRRLTAGFVLAIVVLNWAMFPLYIVPGTPPPFLVNDVKSEQLLP